MSLVLLWCAAALALLGHGLAWSAVVNRLHGLAGPRWFVKGLTYLCALGVVLVPLLIAARWATASPGAFDLFAADTVIGVYAWACAALGAAALVVKPWVELMRYNRSVLVDWDSERHESAKALGAKPIEGRLARLLDYVPGNEATALSIDRKRLALPRLPAALDGLTIAHLSDLHMTGQIGRDYFSFLADRVNSLRPDVIAITGDIVENESCWPWLAPSLGRLCAPLGVYFVLGNHDGYIDADRTRRLLADEGLICLSGRWARAEWNGVPVLLGGNEQPWMAPAPPLDALPPRSDPPSDFRLVLCHTPDQFGWCCRAEADLALAGHTHGGQVQAPVLGVILSPSLFGARYACGVFRRGHTVLHVSRGVAGATPLRWRCPPEAALLELTPST